MCVPKDSIHVREMSALMFLHLLDTIYYIRREPLWSFGRDAEKSKNLRGQEVIGGHLIDGTGFASKFAKIWMVNAYLAHLLPASLFGSCK